jgi:hypothetical protein
MLLWICWTQLNIWMFLRAFDECWSYLHSSPKLYDVQWNNQHSIDIFTDLPQTVGVKNQSRNIRKTNPFMKIVLLSTHELKNALRCSIEHLICHHYCCKPLPSGILGKEIYKKIKCYFSHVEFFSTLDCSQEHLTSDQTFYIPPLNSIMLEGTLNMPLIFL